MKKIVSLMLISSQLYATQPIDHLRQHYSWPINKPSATPDPQSMFVNGEELSELLNDKIHLIVELGAWLGGSTRYILDHAPSATVITIDHWKGSLEHHQQSPYTSKLPKLYETFLVNCWKYKDRLIPMKTTTLQGLEEIYQAGLKPDVVYVDASHEYEAVVADLEKIHMLFPNTRIMGDDWSWPTVRAAVTDFAKRYNFKVIANDKKNFWRFER